MEVFVKFNVNGGRDNPGPGGILGLGKWGNVSAIYCS